MRMDSNKQDLYQESQNWHLTGHTIPRLELCAAVLAVEIAQTVQDHIDTEFQEVKYYTDSHVALGYIHNETRRFVVYVSNRAQERRQTKDSVKIC